MDLSDRPALQLVWSRPPKAVPARRLVNLAYAIERHLKGGDDLTDADFVRWYATGRAPLHVVALPPRG